MKWREDGLEIIDQTKLPNELSTRICKTGKEIAEAVKFLRIRGAPAIGIAAAYGVVLDVRNATAKNYEELRRVLDESCTLLANTRPTAVNLFWAIRRMKRCAERNRERPIPEIKKMLEEEAVQIHEEDRMCCRRIGEVGEKLIRNETTVLTQCNAGALATGGIGTALAILYVAKEFGKEFRVFVCETRPLLQGARLTAFELQKAEIDVTLICDNMVGALMNDERIDMVITGADRIAANGDTANKIGTYQIAVLAKEHKIPFYIAAPTSTLDLELAQGTYIPIEHRDKKELTEFFGKRIAPHGVNIYNPAFDVTPGQLIKGIITEKGIATPPYEISLKEILSKSPH